jgi:hypothetical protein
MLRAHAVVCATEPRFQIHNDETNHRHVIFGQFWLGTFRDNKMLIAPLGKRRVARAGIRHYFGSRLNCRFNKATQRLCATIGDDFEAQSPSIAAPSMGHGAVFLGLPAKNFNGSHHKDFIIAAAPLVMGSSANPRLMNFNMIVWSRATDPVAIRTYHTRTQLVQDLESSLVPAEPKLALELNGR